MKIGKNLNILVVVVKTKLFQEDIPLYMVTELIEGSTLENFVAEGVMNIFDAVHFTLKLLDIFEYFHQRNIII
ncbi:hypothetical protein [Okeania hirsuta]|uniref:hypothetical protein n=1 Tax=Okeania hirsuta TaxID=1458930 RepID=UPI001290FF58